jgi:poly-beta-1,6-N-acetyl-D-glucosamine synthase
MPSRYLLISPCRDESEFMMQTLESVAAQSVPPALWIVVDDGSTDATPAILERYRAKIPYLRVITRTDRGARSVGPGVIEAFYAGLDTVNVAEFDYICKLDLDLDLPPRYFELLIKRMQETPRLGTTSGKPYFKSTRNGKMVPEVCGDEMSVGMTKFYRVPCFQDIGGFVRQVMWDGIDCHRCRMLGWIAESVDDEPLRFIHLRPMGSSQKGIWTGRLRFGYGQYFMGSAPLYFLTSAVFRLGKHPVVIGSVASVWGFLASALRRLPRYNDPEFRKFLRKYQYACLRLGKRRATLLTNEKQEAIWRARSPA